MIPSCKLNLGLVHTEKGELAALSSQLQQFPFPGITAANSLLIQSIGTTQPEYRRRLSRLDAKAGAANL